MTSLRSESLNQPIAGPIAHAEPSAQSYSGRGALQEPRRSDGLVLRQRQVATPQLSRSIDLPCATGF
ncbi:MAG: hypothetical protein DWQ34_22070 [Planctomycetota bacterium]|nr:MAG: hypothetical protein DWQ34_22070 [Planctomycetota bacterium]REJ94940.1 MAG: hypothetical protein DWQ29_02435 [Planctomycetota bacterium]REK22430.1 MAG: hypothetical protein DWQ41_19170 [Planctomycetota bacterium]REK34920.1 MAG: hypothetical protein DWQ45_12495 [Planctomycetota bacterium]